MAKLTIVLTGDAEINRSLSNLTGAQAKQAIRKASRAALRPMLAAARAALPVRSGRLRKAVKLRTLKRSRTRVGARVTTGVDGNDFAGKAFYGGFLEYGWKTGKRGSKNRKQIAGKGHLKKAADANKDAVLSIYRTETRNWIEQIAKGK